MRTKAAAVVLALVLTAACGGDGGEGGGSGRDPGKEGAAGRDKTLTQAQLESALLTLPDFPTGWEVNKQTEAAEDEVSVSPGADSECLQKYKNLSSSEKEGSAAVAVANFNAPDGRGGVGQLLKSYETDADLEKQFEDAAKLVADCQTISSIDKDGARTDLTVGALSLPKLGDDSASFALNGKSSGIDIGINYAVVRVGRTVTVLFHAGFAINTADTAVLEEAAKKAVTKLEAVVAAA